MLALDNKEKGFVPLAAAAIPLDDTKLLSINNCPFGFYQQGRLFCFLPLPEQAGHPVLPVHLNGTFALTSSRQNLLISTKENTDNSEGDWNSALMSDAVCRAYLLLLESLQDVLLDNQHTFFYQLWPRSENSLFLADSFYTCLVNQRFRLFPCQAGWVSFDKVRFFNATFRNSPVGDLALELILEFWEHKASLSDIPSDIYNSLKSRQKDAFVEKCLTEDQFYEDIFFPSISSDFWTTPLRVQARDTLTRHAVVNGSNRVKRLLSTFACIPCQHSSDLKIPGQLVHPRSEAAALFLPADGRFPQPGSEEGDVDFCQSDCLENLIHLGMATNDLEWKEIIQRALSVKELLEFDEKLAYDRAHMLLDYLAATSSSLNAPRVSLCPRDVMNKLSATEFLPVLKKPDDWPFPWFEDDLQSPLAAPCRLYHRNMENIVACTQKIFASFPSSDLCFKTSENSRSKVLECLQIGTHERPTDEKTLQSALNQILLVAPFYESHSEIPNIKTKTSKICHAVYFFLQQCFKSSIIEKKEELILKPLKCQRIILTGSDFCHPSKLAFKAKLSCPPYLQEVSEFDRINFKDFFQFLGVREKFGTQDILGVMEEMKQDVGDRQLSDDQVELFYKAAHLFCFARQETQDVVPVNSKELFLPDREGLLQCVENLCLDDSSSLRLKPGMHFIHDKFSPEVAKTLGVKSKNSTIFKSHLKVKSFGQSEKLTNRVKRLLQGYTCDVSIFKEFIQNADDAGATEIRFIKDFRQLGTDSVPDGWKELQGPALCVYNNADFTSKDIEGIQNLGEGSKGEEMMKTGQFGVGFNAVYHITDVPSFWTRRDGTEQVICVCDPCVLIPNELQEQGMELDDIDSFKNEYPDVFDGYLGNTFDMSKPATLFRLPLRSKWMAAKSTIKKEPVTQHALSRMLTDFIKEASKCLLFVNNLTKIGVYSTEDGRTLERDYEVELVIDKNNALKKEAFYMLLKEKEEALVDDTLNFDLTEVQSTETVVRFSLKDSRGAQEDWIQVNKAGCLDVSNVPQTLQEDWRKEHFRLLPRGGVAVKVRTRKPQSADSSTLQDRISHMLSTAEKVRCQAFCTLPLPVETGLPIHVNGHFALEHESRRNLWDRQDDSRTTWNRLICTNLIAPAYVRVLKEVKVAWFGQKQRENETSTTGRIPEFFALFPRIPSSQSSMWSHLVESFYQLVIGQRQALFPVTKADTDIITWTAVRKDDDFVAYFTRPYGYVSVTPSQSSKALQNETEATISDENHADLPNTEEETVSQGNLAELLKRLNMKIVHAPLHIFTALKHYGADRMREATPSAVLEFLNSCTSQTPDSCSLKNLPQPLHDLDLAEDDVVSLAEFVAKSLQFSSNIRGIPLCLLQSGNLDVFSESRQVFITGYYELFPMLSEEFLHCRLVDIFSRVADKIPNLLKTFTISHLAERLSCCLDQNHFKRGQSCLVNSGLLPHETWLQQLWGFLEHRLNLKGEDISALLCLNEWSLIPCKVVRQEECFLYPVQDREKVLFLPQRPLVNSEEDQAVNVLQKLMLPVTDESIISQNLAEKLVASVNNPASVIHVLTSCRNTITLSQGDALSILNYFAFCAKETKPLIPWGNLREIPMFCTIGGRVTSLDFQDELLFLPEEIPQDGLEVWSQATKTGLLIPWRIPNAICKVLCLNKPPNLHMSFWKRFLSTLEYLPKDFVYTHIVYIKDTYREHCIVSNETNEVKELFRVLSETPFVKTEVDKMNKPSQFYSPHNIVFREMHDADKFPPEPYCDNGWCYFMEKAGMVKDVTVQMFISFAKQVEAEGRETLSKKTLTRSKTLVRHLFHRSDLSSSGLLKGICDIQFARPWSFAEATENEGLANIHPPFVANRLVSFSECCRSCHWPLLWSTVSILHPDDDPGSFITAKKELKVVLQQLKIEENVPMEQFKQHVVSVCQVLSTSTCNLLCSSNGRREVEWLFGQIYKFLSNIKPHWLHFFKNKPVVFDSYSGRLLYPDQVVISLQSDEVVDGWLFRAPANYDDFYELLTALGASPTVTADHYARVLTKLHGEYQHQPLEGGMLQACKKAVQGLFRCLRVSPQLTEEVLYLPNEQFCLKPSADLIFNDTSNLKARLQSCCDRFFLNLKQLGLDSSSHWNDISVLPELHRPMRLSAITTEIIPQSVLFNKTMGSLAQTFKRKVSSVDFTNGVARLAYHKNKQVAKGIVLENSICQKIRDNLKSIEVFEMENLHTVLIVKEEEMRGSEAKHTIFRDKRFPRRVFVDSRESLSDDSLNMSLADVVIEAADEDLSEFRLLLLVMLECHDIEALLDMHNISGLSHNRSCKPGCYLPIADICLLGNCFTNTFEVDEDVALEVYDPLIEREDRQAHQVSTPRHLKGCVPPDRDEMARKLENPPEEDEIISHQVFIYARVLEKTDIGLDAPHPCCMSYRVDIGHLRTITVSAVRLYKIPTNCVGDMSDLHDMSSSQAAAHDPKIDVNVVSDLRACLEDSLPTLGERRLQLGLLKRLFLQWHPDLNIQNVRPQLFEEIKELTAAYGRKLDESSRQLVGTVNKHATHQPTVTPAFFDRVHQRGRLLAAHMQTAMREKSDPKKQHKRKNPQPGEGRRWLCRASVDLKAAKNTTKGSSWHCFICHQAAEKALKAVLFHNDANDKLLHPTEKAELGSLARAVGDKELIRAVESLEGITGERWKLYPFAQWAPQTPTPLYTPDTARSAYRQAGDILTIAASLMK